MKNREWLCEFENGETAIVRAITKRTANLFADSLEDEIGCRCISMQEIIDERE